MKWYFVEPVKIRSFALLQPQYLVKGSSQQRANWKCSIVQQMLLKMFCFTSMLLGSPEDSAEKYNKLF